MIIRSVAAAVFVLFGAASAHATMAVADEQINYGPYTLSYALGNVLTSPNTSFAADGGQVGLSWELPATVAVLAGADAVSRAFVLADFTISANAGYALSGPVFGSLGNFTYNEVGGAATSAVLSGMFSINGLPATSFSGALTRSAGPSLFGVANTGYYSSAGSAAIGPFSTLKVSGLTLTLSAGGGVYSSVLSQPQNKLEISMIAAPVPEPETYAMLLAGLGVLGAIAVRRGKAAV